MIVICFLIVSLHHDSDSAIEKLLTMQKDQKVNHSDFISVNWKDAKEMIDNGELVIIGSNYSQINNQGEYTLSADGKKMYKRRHTASKVIFDLIAEFKVEYML